jgi:metallo-beta-lactamase family protein
MKVSFHGAAQNVTGSCHLVETESHRILVDCGLFQGSGELHDDNAVPFGFDAAAIDAVLLTHAHLDHCGRLPLLVKRGFKGEIIATQATAELAQLVLMDSAKLQEEDAEWRQSHAGRDGAPPPGPPLYTTDDVTETISRFKRPARYGETVEVQPGVRATYYNAGHILGSASILVEAEEKSGRHSILFSGDIGSPNHPLLRPPQTPPSAEMVVMETTYGDRLHSPFSESLKQLYAAINAALPRGGNVVIPTFALERAQELLFFLRQGVAENQLPPSIQVYLDSPMAISATQIFERHRDDFSPLVTTLFDKGVDPFALPGLHFTRDSASSIAINRIKSGAIIMAGSGMAAGGRIRHHLIHNLPRKESSIVFVGYAADGTLGRRLMDGAKQVHILGKPVPVHASVQTISGFSAHADQAELLAWQAGISGTQKIALVHGELGSMQAFAAKLGDKAVIPKRNDEIDLS